MSRPKVVLTARVKDRGKFPFVPVNIKRGRVVLPVEHSGRVYLPADILGYFLRYPHVGGRCLFPNCRGSVARHVESVGKGHVDAFTRFQVVERDFARVHEGLLPLSGPIVKEGGKTIAECAEKFERDIRDGQRKKSTIETYMHSVDCLRDYAASVGIQNIGQIDKSALLGFVGWLKTKLKTRANGHPNNTYRNRLRNVGVFLRHSEVEMPLRTKDWPKEVKGRKEKFSMESIRAMLKAADTIDRGGVRGEAADDKDLIHFAIKTGFRDEEIMHAQYSDINFKNSTVNVTAKPKGTFPLLPKLEWMPKDREPRQVDITVDDTFLRRMKKRKERYGASSSGLIFPNRKGGVDHHLVRVIQRLASHAGVEGKIGLHKFRKTFGTWVAKTEGLEAARLMLGHQDIATTQAYLAADEKSPEKDRLAAKKRFAELGG